MLGLNTAVIGAKVGGFFSMTWLRAVVIILSLAAMAFAMWQTVDTVRDWQQVSYQTGFVAGQNEANKEWQRVAADNFKKQRDQAIEDANRNNTVVSHYLSDVQVAEQQQGKTKEEIKSYAQTSVGSRRCVNGDGVRITLQGRRNLGFAEPASKTH